MESYIFFLIIGRHAINTIVPYDEFASQSISRLVRQEMDGKVVWAPYTPGVVTHLPIRPRLEHEGRRRTLDKGSAPCTYSTSRSPPTSRIF